MLVILVFVSALLTTCIMFLLLTFAKARWAWDAGAPVVMPSIVMGLMTVVSWIILQGQLEASIHGFSLYSTVFVGSILAPLTAVALIVLAGYLLWQLCWGIDWAANKAAALGRRHRAEAGLPPVVHQTQQEQ